MVACLTCLCSGWVGGSVASRMADLVKSRLRWSDAGSKLACTFRVSAAVVLMAPVMTMAAFRWMVLSAQMTAPLGGRCCRCLCLSFTVTSGAAKISAPYSIRGSAMAW